MSFRDELQQASWRGVPFGVNASDGRFGRKLAVHEYPNRDDVWVEDMGRAARRIGIRGFLLENDRVYGGGDVIAQREAMIGASEQAGSGSLVHPTLGTLMVSLLSFECSERKEDGQMFEIHLSFIETGLRIFPGIATSTLDAVTAAASAANIAAGTDFATRALADLQQGAAVVQQAASTATLWATKAQGLVNDATNAVNMVSRLTGSYGRLFGGRAFGFLNSPALQTVQQANASVQSLIALGTVARANVTSAANALSGVAGALGL